MDIVTEAVTRNLRQDPQFQDGTDITIHHHVAEPDQAMDEPAKEELEVQTKSLLLESPKIGGIVGIGVHNRTTQDATRVLVTESILSTPPQPGGLGASHLQIHLPVWCHQMVHLVRVREGETMVREGLVAHCRPDPQAGFGVGLEVFGAFFPGV